MFSMIKSFFVNTVMDFLFLSLTFWKDFVVFDTKKTNKAIEPINPVVEVFKSKDWKPFNYISSIDLSNNVSDERFLYALVDNLRNLNLCIPKLIDTFQSGFYISTPYDIFSNLEQTTREYNKENNTDYTISKNVTFKIHLNKMFLARDKLNKTPVTQYFLLKDSEICQKYAITSIINTSSLNELSDASYSSEFGIVEIDPSKKFLFVLPIPSQ